MIRLAKNSDISQIMEIVTQSIKLFQKEENPQWQTTYPSKEHFYNDIKNQNLYVLEEETQIKGFICIAKNDTESYEDIKESNSKDSYVFHRLGVNEKFRRQHVATSLIQYGEELAIKDHTPLIKADTEVHNHRMNQLFQKLGYKKIATISWPDYPGKYNYYEKKLGSESNEL